MTEDNVDKLFIFPNKVTLCQCCEQVFSSAYITCWVVERTCGLPSWPLCRSLNTIILPPLNSTIHFFFADSSFQTTAFYFR